MSNQDLTPLSDVLKRAGEHQGHSEYAQPRHRATIQNIPAPAPDNVKRIAEWITQLTWREAVTMSQGIEDKLKANSDSHTAAMVGWAEELLKEGKQ